MVKINAYSFKHELQTRVWCTRYEKSFFFNLTSRAKPMKTSAIIGWYKVTSQQEHKQFCHNGGQWAWVDLEQEF